jgi:hypothetical protein
MGVSVSVSLWMVTSLLSSSLMAGTTLAGVGTRWLGSAARARAIVAAVVTAVARFDTIARQCWLPAATRNHFAADFARRLTRIGSAA